MGARYQADVELTRPWWRRYLWRWVAHVYSIYLLLNTSVLIPLRWPVPPGQLGHTALRRPAALHLPRKQLKHHAQQVPRPGRHELVA